MSVVRAVRPKDVFKHYLLGQLLRGMTMRHEVNWDYFDFAPGPGQYVLQDEKTLSQVFSYSRKLFAERKINPFHEYIEDIARFNSGETGHTKKQPPPSSYMPLLYPSSAGFASLHLGKRDRAIFVDSSSDNRTALTRLFQGEPRVKVVASKDIDETVQLAKVLVPPTHHRGFVVWDLDHLIEEVAPSELESNKSQFVSSHATLIDEAASILHSVIKRWPTCSMFIPYPMTSHIPPVSVVRTILNSGATQVLNCSMFWEKREDIPGIAVGAIVVNPPKGFESAVTDELPQFQQMFGLSPGVQACRVYSLTTPRTPKADLPTMTGKPTKEVPIQEDFDRWVNRDFDRDEKEALDEVGKLPEPQPFEDDPEGAKAKRMWGRFISEQIGQGQLPRVRATIKVPRDKAPPPTPAPVSAPQSRFRKAT